MANDIMEGSITVVGKDRLEIRLVHGKPDTVLVEFKDGPSPVPCNPHHDVVKWELIEKHGGFYLNIIWNVSSLRKIVWAVSFV